MKISSFSPDDEEGVRGQVEVDDGLEGELRREVVQRADQVTCHNIYIINIIYILYNNII